MIIDNPFSDYGQVILPERFVGRTKEVLSIKQRVLSRYGGGCISIVGESRVGKTSLMRFVLNTENPDVIATNSVLVEVNLSLWRRYSIPDFFHGIIRSINESIKTQYHEYASDAQAVYDSVWEDSTADITFQLRYYLQNTHNLGLRIVLMLDMFDAIEDIFGGDSTPYLLLREIAASSHYGTSLVTTSRLDISSLEVQDRKISALAPIFTIEYLGLMTDFEYKDMFKRRLHNSNTSLTSKEIEWIQESVGNHPYFSQLIAYQLWNFKFANNRKRTVSDKDMKKIFEGSLSEIIQVFDRYAERMSDAQQILLNEIVCNNKRDMKITDLDYFLQRGLVQYKDYRYIAFGKIYKDYLCSFYESNSNKDFSGPMRRYTGAVIIAKTQDNKYRFLITKTGKSNHWELPKIPHEEDAINKEILGDLLRTSTNGQLSISHIEFYEPLDIRTYVYETMEYHLCILQSGITDTIESEIYCILPFQDAKKRLKYSDDKEVMAKGFEAFMKRFGEG